MRVLVIGGGGREHALVWKLAQSRTVKKIYGSPGNPGIAQHAECLPGTLPEDYLRIAEEHVVDLTIVGPEAPLVAGVVDRFRAAGRAIVGPTSSAAQLEGSKQFAKDFMMRAGIPTAHYVSAQSQQEALSALDQFSYPLVLKADGLAAGKGVVIAQAREQAEEAIPSLLAINGRLIVEEFLAGEEVSFIALSDGKRVLPFAATQDHKNVFDNDRGPNTGGMGAYCDSRILSTRQAAAVMSKVIQPAIARMSEEGNPFTGFLYAGLMITEAGPKVLEFNVRLGDPETQVLMHAMSSDLPDVLAAAAHGELTGASLSWGPEPSVCVVMAAAGYPGAVRTGDPIKGIDAAENTGATVFQAGTNKKGDWLVTAGGRVLGVTASGPNLGEAIGAVYNAVDQIHFEGMHYRRDIAARGLQPRD